MLSIICPAGFCHSRWLSPIPLASAMPPSMSPSQLRSRFEAPSQLYCAVLCTQHQHRWRAAFRNDSFSERHQFRWRGRALAPLERQLFRNGSFSERRLFDIFYVKRLRNDGFFEHTSNESCFFIAGISRAVCFKLAGISRCWIARGHFAMLDSSRAFRDAG